ncbi:MAG: hypothetical protein LBD18_02905 [Treponema sp.]|nr:hypothetical protein [Treponema sp.]
MDVYQTPHYLVQNLPPFREVRTVTDTGWLEGKGNWKDLKTIIQYRFYREGTGKGAGKWMER